MTILAVFGGQETTREASSSYNRTKIIAQTLPYAVESVPYQTEAFEGDTGEAKMLDVPCIGELKSLGEGLISLNVYDRQGGSNGHYRGGRCYIYNEDDVVIGGVYVDSYSLQRVYIPILNEWRGWSSDDRSYNSAGYHLSKTTVDYSLQTHTDPDLTWLVTSLWCNGSLMRVMKDEVNKLEAEALTPAYLGLIGSQSHYPNYRLYNAILRHGKSARNCEVKQLRYTSAGTHADQDAGTVDSINNIGGSPQSTLLPITKDGAVVTFKTDDIPETWLKRHRILGLVGANICSAGSYPDSKGIVNIVRTSDGTIHDVGDWEAVNAVSYTDCVLGLSEINPATGNPWLGTELVGMEFGVRLNPADAVITPTGSYLLTADVTEDSVSVIDTVGINTWAITGSVISTSLTTHLDNPVFKFDGGVISCVEEAPAPGLEDFTLEGYLRVSSLLTNQVILDYTPLGLDGDYLNVYITDTDLVVASGTTTVLSKPHDIVANGWYKIVVVRKDGVVYLLVNDTIIGYIENTIEYIPGGAGRPCAGGSGTDTAQNTVSGYMVNIKLSIGDALYV